MLFTHGEESDSSVMAAVDIVNRMARPLPDGVVTATLPTYVKPVTVIEVPSSVNGSTVPATVATTGSDAGDGGEAGDAGGDGEGGALGGAEGELDGEGETQTTGVSLGADASLVSVGDGDGKSVRASDAAVEVGVAHGS